MTGRKMTRKPWIHDDTASAVCSGRWSARLLGASSPITMCNAVTIEKAMTNEIAWSVVEPISRLKAWTMSSMITATTGSPIQPSARLEIVIPSCVAAM